MAKATRIVVDTNIVKSIGKAPSASSLPLIDALNAARDARLRLVTTSELDDEWDKHMPANGLFLEWQADMVARGLVGARKLRTLVALTRRLLRVIVEEARDAVKKDAHIAAAALETEARVLSLDDKIRGHLARASNEVEELREVLWANPSSPMETVPKWLLQGAPHEDERTLGNWL